MAGSKNKKKKNTIEGECVNLVNLQHGLQARIVICDSFDKTWLEKYTAKTTSEDHPSTYSTIVLHVLK